MIKGWMALSTDPKYCYEMSTIPNTKIISLDEDNTYPEIDPKINNGVIHGTILLPAPEVLWAEIDGDEYKFNSLYFEQLMSINISEFIYTLIGYLYRGGNIIIYTENISTSIRYLIDFFQNAYGIHMATSESNPFTFDLTCVPMWAIGIYSLGIITPFEFLKEFPIDAEISKDIYTKLIVDINPYSELNNYYEKIDYINLLRKNKANGCPIRCINMG